MTVLILGGGVIGTSIACQPAARGADAIAMEPSAAACAASGKSGGFLALDWCDGTPLMQLARRSFALHAELADEPGGGWGYRRITTYGGAVARVGFAGRRDQRPALLNAPATGEAMAELILDGAARTTDLSPFDPGRVAVAHRLRG